MDFARARLTLARLQVIFKECPPEDVIHFYVTCRHDGISHEVFSYMFEQLMKKLAYNFGFIHWFRVYEVQKISRRYHVHVLGHWPGIREGSTWIGPGNHWLAGRELRRARHGIWFMAGSCGLGWVGVEPLRPYDRPLHAIVRYLTKYVMKSAFSSDEELDGARVVGWSRTMPKYSREELDALDLRRKEMIERMCLWLHVKSEKQFRELAIEKYPDLAWRSESLAIQKFWAEVLLPWWRANRDNPF